MPESLRLFTLCDSMRWAHLPEPGGLYAQHPRLLDEWSVIFNRRAEHREREQEKRDREMKQKQASARRRR